MANPFARVSTPGPWSVRVAADQSPPNSIQSTPVVTRPSSGGNSSPPLSLEFHANRDAAFNIEPYMSSSIYTGVIPEARNGTLLSEATTYLKVTEKGIERLGHAINGHSCAPDWNKAARKARILGEVVVDSVNDRVNQAMQGWDATAILHKAQHLVPNVSLPTKQHTEKILDGITDTVQQILIRKPHGEPFTDEEFEGVQWVFSRIMGKKAKTALLGQQICSPWQVMVSRKNMYWQMQLVQALADLYELVKDEYCLQELIGMTPTWVGDRESRTWRLIIDTEINAIDEVTLTDKSIFLYPAFELSEEEGMVKVADYTRSTMAVDNGEWENVESVSSSISAPSSTDKPTSEHSDSTPIALIQVVEKGGFGENVWEKE